MGAPEKGDQILDLIGNFGRWQAMIILLISVTGIPAAWQVLVTSFLTPKVDHFCTPDTNSNEQRSFAEWKQYAEENLGENVTFAKCNANVITNGVLTENNESSCDSWTYDNSFYPRTVITEFDLVCSSDILVTISQMVFFVGILFGVISSGIASDRLGRKRVAQVSSFGVVIFGVATAYAPNVWIFFILRFFVAFFNISVFTTCYVYCMEIVGGTWAIIIGIGLEFPWAIGYCFLPLLAYYVPDWSDLQLAISLPIIISVIITFIIPENPRWLLAESRLEEAEDILIKAVSMNKRSLPEGLVPVNNTKAQAGFTDLFRTPNIRKKTLIQYFLWFTCSFVYYGLTLNSGSLIPDGSLHINFLAGGLIEFPAYGLTIVVLLFFGRRIPLAFVMLMGGVALLLTLVVPKGAAVLAMATIGKFGITAAFAIVYLYAAELFPTVLRQTGLGSSSMFARIGGILAPLVAREVGKLAQSLPILIFAAFSLTAGVLALFLPETHNRLLPDTLEEGEQFGKEDSFFDFSLRKRNTAQEPKQTSKPQNYAMENKGFSS